MNERLLPAYPLWLKDPYYSIWLNGEYLQRADTVFWHGEPKPIRGWISENGINYFFMGGDEGGLVQTSLRVDAFNTIFSFACERFDLTVKFFSPLPLNDLEVLSCPVCYLAYEINAKTPLPDFSIHLEIEERIAYNTCFNENRKESIRGGVVKQSDCEIAYFGLRRQLPLSGGSDECGADWGFWYLCGDMCDITLRNERKYLTASKHALSGFFTVGFDDLCAVNYFGEWLKGYWFRNGKTIFDALRFSKDNYARISAECAYFDAELKSQCAEVGEGYENICHASLRQSIAAHKLVENKDGRLLWLSKECNSGGFIATLDVTYPSIPLFLLYAPELVKGMLYPILDFARMPVWEYEFAPHDSGYYPYCNGQLYGAENQENKNNSDIYVNGFKAYETMTPFYLFPSGSNIYRLERQMPVEECGNMLISAYAYYTYSKDKLFLLENLDLFEKWSKYLIEYGLIPDNQLCTDDFAGHLDKNANLAVKAVLGIACLSHMKRILGDENEYQRLNVIARSYARKWRELYIRGEHSVLAFGLEGDSFSLKYNLAFDSLLSLDLFGRDMKEAEVNHYISKMNTYGTPLDSRKDYTKTDWLMWAASLSDDKAKTGRFITAINNFLRQSPDRVPFSDWIETKEGTYKVFRNRTVQGGCFILLLKQNKK